jgi:hypothetical protein
MVEGTKKAVICSSERITAILFQVKKQVLKSVERIAIA